MSGEAKDTCEPASITTEQRLILLRSLKRITIVRTGQTVKYSELFETVTGLFSPYTNDYSRLMDVWRMPNFLLYGSDIIGPDYSDALNDIIQADGLKEHMRIAKRSFMSAGRSVNPGEEEIAQTHSALYVASPHSTQNDMNFLNRPIGCFLVFFKPDIMKAMHIQGQLYASPPPDAISAMFLSWPGEMHITSE